MLSTWLVEHSLLARSALVALGLVSVAVAAMLVRAGQSGRRAAGVLAALALTPVAVLTLTPTSRDLEGAPWCALQFAVPTLGAVEALANVALLAPFVLFAAVALRRPGRALLLGVGLAVAVEAVQAAVPALGRACDTQDLAMNTIGAVAAAAVAWALLACVRPRRSSPAQPWAMSTNLE